MKRRPAPSPYQKLDVKRGPPPAYEPLEAKSKEVTEDELELEAALRMSMELQALAQRVQPAASAEAEAGAALLPGGEEAPLPSLLAAGNRGVGDDGSEVEVNAGHASYSCLRSPKTKATPRGGADEARIHEGGGPGTADNDPYGWMHPCLASLLPESIQSSEGIWNATISALKVRVRV